MSKQPFMPAKPEEPQAVQGPGAIRLEPRNLTLKAPFFIGSGAVKTINSGDVNPAVNKAMKVDVDWSARVVWVHLDQGGRILSGWTPFENVIGCNCGTREVESKSAA